MLYCNKVFFLLIALDLLGRWVVLRVLIKIIHRSESSRDATGIVNVKNVL
jgi:hypothetical protein